MKGFLERHLKMQDKIIRLRKTGIFYTAYDRDAVLLSEKFGYRFMCAFPEGVLDRNIKELEADGISCRIEGGIPKQPKSGTLTIHMG